MKLELTVLRCPDTVAPEARTVTGGELSVGRGPGVDWILPDGDRLLSKRHFALAFRSGSWPWPVAWRWLPLLCKLLVQYLSMSRYLFFR